MIYSGAFCRQISHCSYHICRALSLFINGTSCHEYLEELYFKKCFFPRARSLKVLWDKFGLLKPMEFLGSFGFCKRCMISWNLPQGALTKLMLFCDGFLMHYFILKLFPKCDTPNLIYVINHVEKIFRDLRCQKCGKY